MPEQTEVEWPTCERAGCIGVRLASTRTCLAHAGEEETAAALKFVGETGAIDARGVPVARALLEQILTAVPRGTDGKPLIKDCRFDRATFNGDAVFREVTFNGDAVFDGATFDSIAGFDQATFNGGAAFGEVTFNGIAGFNRTTFGGTAGFRAATFSSAAAFNEAAFKALSWFAGTTFSGTAFFAGATFSDAGFDGAAFGGSAVFREVGFRGIAAFDEATFSGDAAFSLTTFSGEARFRRAAFNGYAQFDGTAFNGYAGFGRAAFSADARFHGATFKHCAVFAGARFEQARQFGPVLAYRGLELDEVQFAQPVQIEVSSTGVRCRRARFPGGVQFRLRWACVLLDDTDLPVPSILAGIPRLSDEGLARREEQIARAWRRLLAGEISERPQLVSLRRTNVAGLALSNVSVADCRFADAHNLGKLRLESDVGFVTAPLRGGLGRRRWGGREVIAEERDWRANLSRRHWVAPSWPGWLGDQRPGVLDPGQIAGLYRALRKGREDVKDEPGAADFYYGEMEMRHARPLSGSTPSGQSSATSRGGAERGILTAYWMVSGYGLRAWRALAWLAVVTAILAIAFHLVGFAIPPRPISYWTSLLYAFRATLSLTDDQVKLTAWGKLLQGVLRLTGPVLLGLALLALRGRVKR